MQYLPELEKSYAAMNPFARKLIREIAAGYAIDFPAPKKSPSLLLVANGSRVEPLTNDGENPIYRAPLVIVSKPVDSK